MKRQISFGQALATVIGSVIGAGVFFKIGTITAQTGSSSTTIFVWILAGIISIASGLTISEIAASLKINGAIKYLDYTYGRVWGFLFGWAQMIVYFPAQIGALSSIFGVQFVSLFGINAKYANLIAIFLVLFLLAINLIGTKFSSKMQSVITILKVIPIVLIIIWGFFNQNKIAAPIFPLTVGNNISFPNAISQGLLSALFAFEGWIVVTNLANEVKNPEKDLSRAIILGLSAITLIYVLINYTFLTVLPIHDLVNNNNAAFEASMKLFGQFGGKLVTIGILISVYGAVNAFMLTGMRTPYILAQDNLLPFSNKIGKANIHTGVPVMGALIVDAIAIVMILLGNFTVLTDMLVFVMWTFNTMLAIAVIILRKREPELRRPFKVPWYPIIPIISILGGIFIVVSTIINQFILSIIGIGLTLLGLPIYFYMQKQNKEEL
ncbi:MULTISPECIES: APC family permease [Lactobacillus]|uniref:Amino acid permease n=2 Tax=Lactobacillus gallinarum TaxID=52242 RepID=A0A1Y4U229_9LACO|nr:MULTISPECIES: amino acid permease [Lactobacillus]MBL1060042.1 amino acid permease [Lactobacillus sp. A27]KRL21107.1 amino acid permease [Lactobacillus gallinarum DSM 10532 = JCM 2011]MCC9271464.1 amino acid permease [Lactobacillus gallinarum]MDM8276296.1 amino acid permease [Lactobacillus gallinarum]MDM8282021.1 amino acid permease [Lactobacillus gallinarum]